MNSIYSVNFVAVSVLHVQIFILLHTVTGDLHTNFFELYGNDYNTSGIWEPVRSLASSPDKLANISLQAHRGSWMCNNSEVVREVFFETQIMARTSREYQDIQIDLIKYSVTRFDKDGKVTKGPASFFYLSKGTRPDCVYYCWKRGLDKGKFYLDYHVCNITMPTPYAFPFFQQQYHLPASVTVFSGEMINYKYKWVTNLFRQSGTDV